MSDGSNQMLVEMEGSQLAQLVIKRVLRTYNSEQRAEEDRELLALANPDADYLVVPVPHIDN